MVSEERTVELGALQEALQYHFQNIQLLNKALTHKSYVNESPQDLKNNERFEFLGDAVLDLVVSQHLVLNYPDYAEGILSKIRAAVVNESCLAGMARQLGLGSFLLLGRGEEGSGGREKNSLLANAFEALTGALFLDGGLENARRVLQPYLVPEIDQYADQPNFRDYKSELQEVSQNRFNCIPAYRVVNESGPDHAKMFEAVVMIRNEIRGNGTGRSKKEAEQAAAQAALDDFLD